MLIFVFNFFFLSLLNTITISSFSFLISLFQLSNFKLLMTIAQLTNQYLRSGEEENKREKPNIWAWAEARKFHGQGCD